MTDWELPADVQALLFNHIESYEQLEILLLVRREASANWTAERIGSRLAISAILAKEALTALCASRLVKLRSGSLGLEYEYAAESPALDESVSGLASVYTTHRFEIIKTMSANAIKRMRTGALRAFADAFILRKDKGNG